MPSKEPSAQPLAFLKMIDSELTKVEKFTVEKVTQVRQKIVEAENTMPIILQTIFFDWKSTSTLILWAFTRS
jgi:hypothetical protein